MKYRLLTILASLTLAFNLYAEPLAVGAAAPVAVAKDHDGKEVKLASLYEQGMLLVFFYPKAHTGGCTKEVCSMRDHLEDFKKLGVNVIGVSMDKVEDQKSFVDKQNLNFSLIADTEGAIVKGFGVPEMKPGIPKRQSFLVKDGKVVWRDLDVKPEQHVAVVQAALAALAKDK
jgi:peroxiredoxin Q/BCP